MRQEVPKPQASEERGLACPKCGCRHLPVRYTRQRPGFIQRIRECRHCGRRVITRERL
jgi:DNA-directed RNA polymerase subunit RPC12/RpoP